MPLAEGQGTWAGMHSLSILLTPWGRWGRSRPLSEQTSSSQQSKGGHTKRLGSEQLRPAFEPPRSWVGWQRGWVGSWLRHSSGPRAAPKHWGELAGQRGDQITSARAPPAP